MTFSDREHSFEAKFALEEELKFRAGVTAYPSFSSRVILWMALGHTP